MKILAVAWLLIITVLFFLPGSALPHEDFYGIPHFDKYVHTGFFALLVFLWRFYFALAGKYTGILLFLAFCYGLSVELIQHYLIANRSFDLLDVVADMLGAVGGVWVWTRWYKKIDPCRNRGRNQN